MIRMYVCIRMIYSNNIPIFAENGLMSIPTYVLYLMTLRVDTTMKKFHVTNHAWREMLGRYTYVTTYRIAQNFDGFACNRQNFTLQNFPT